MEEIKSKWKSEKGEKVKEKAGILTLLEVRSFFFFALVTCILNFIFSCPFIS